MFFLDFTYPDGLVLGPMLTFCLTKGLCCLASSLCILHRPYGTRPPPPLPPKGSFMTCYMVFLGHNGKCTGASWLKQNQETNRQRSTTFSHHDWIELTLLVIRVLQTSN